MEPLELRRKKQLRSKLWAAIVPLGLLCAVSYGLGKLVLDLLHVPARSTAWWVTVVMFGMALLSYYIVGFFAGSLRLDGNVTSLLSRMDMAEKKAVMAVLQEVIKDDAVQNGRRRGRSMGSCVPSPNKRGNERAEQRGSS